MSRIVLSPLFVGVALMLLLWCGRRWLPRTVRILAGFGVVLCYLFSTQLGADTLLAWVENHADAPCTAPAPEAVVVLAGGVDENARTGDVGALNQYSLRRLLGAVEFWRGQPAGVPLVISGGSVRNGPPEADLMRDFARRLGVPDRALRVEADSRTTWENAQHLALLRPPLPRRVWLVTSAVHMPRALYSLRRAGFQPCPVPVDRRAVPPRRWTAILPTAQAIAKTDAALHELAGLAWYHLKSM